MKTISVTEFRSNIKKYLDVAQNEKVIIHRGKGRAFAVVPVDDINDEPYSPEFIASILQGREDYKNGKCENVVLKDLWK